MCSEIYIVILQISDTSLNGRIGGRLETVAQSGWRTSAWHHLRNVIWKVISSISLTSCKVGTPEKVVKKWNMHWPWLAVSGGENVLVRDENSAALVLGEESQPGRLLNQDLPRPIPEPGVRPSDYSRALSQRSQAAIWKAQILSTVTVYLYLLEVHSSTFKFGQCFLVWCKESTSRRIL